MDSDIITVKLLLFSFPIDSDVTTVKLLLSFLIDSDVITTHNLIFEFFTLIKCNFFQMFLRLTIIIWKMKKIQNVEEGYAKLYKNTF